MSIEYANTHRWSGPTTKRATCGTASPTKPIGPAAAVAAPHRSITATAPRARVRPTFTPRARPIWSPMARALSEGARTRAMTRPAPMKGRAIRTIS
ncbi:hypothetical protein SNARM312S_01747 [Streptomyces narbonensis]